jgi:hypothetical protein
LQILYYIAVLLVMMAIAGLIIWWYFYCKAKPKYNGFLWVHPDKGGGVIDILKEPTGKQKPFYFNYRTLEFGLSFFRQPIWLWAQDKLVDAKGIVSYPIIHWEPKDPSDFGLQATAKGEPDKSKPYVTPNQLFATTDWSCLRVLETSRSSITEAIKLGMAVIMVCVCVFGIIVALDMVGKKDVPTGNITASPPAASMIIERPDYGGLK